MEKCEKVPKRSCSLVVALEIVSDKETLRRVTHEELGPLRPSPPPPNSLCLGFSCIFEEKGDPKHREFTGSGGGGGSRRGVSGAILHVYACFGATNETLACSMHTCRPSP